MTEVWKNKARSAQMTMRQLEAFDSVMKMGLVSAAARDLALSQPSVTRLILDLERAVGFALFCREKKRLVPTVEGHHFAEEVDRSFNGLARLTRFAEDIRNLRNGSLRLAVMPALSFGAVPRAISKQNAAMPDVSILCEQRSSEGVLRAVSAGDVDLGVALDGVNHPGVLSAGRYHATCVCVMPEGHPLASRDTIKPGDLRSLPRVALPHYTSVSVQVNKVLLDAGVDPRPRVEALVSSMACAMVAEGLGVSVLDPFTARSFMGRGIVSVPFIPDIAFDFRIVVSTQRSLSRIAASFIENLIGEFSADPLVDLVN